MNRVSFRFLIKPLVTEPPRSFKLAYRVYYSIIWHDIDICYAHNNAVKRLYND